MDLPVAIAQVLSTRYPRTEEPISQLLQTLQSRQS
jgi:hypothetical protein